MRREGHPSKVTRSDLEAARGIPHLSTDMVESDRNDVASRVELNLSSSGEGKVGGRAREFNGY